jgi:hypothetical protein
MLNRQKIEPYLGAAIASAANVAKRVVGSIVLFRGENVLKVCRDEMDIITQVRVFAMILIPEIGSRLWR